VTWWAWVLLWAAILVGAGWVFFVLGRGLWRQATSLFTEVGTATDRLGAVMEQVDALGEQASGRGDLAVFADPVALRRQREAAARRTARARQRRRRDLVRSRQRP
jgi:class 3 adenylate cyclase